MPLFRKEAVGQLAACMSDPTKREECIEDVLNRVLVQERTLSHSLIPKTDS